LSLAFPSFEMLGNAVSTGFCRACVYSQLDFKVVNQNPGIFHVAPTCIGNSVCTSSSAALGLCPLR